MLRASDGLDTNVELVREGAAAPYFYRGVNSGLEAPSAKRPAPGR